MTSERHARVKALFLAACERPAEERSAFLGRVCGGDEELRREVESLLRFHDETPTSPSGDLERLRFPVGESEIPERIGNYRVLQKLGEGGMGVVYEAEQERPVRRRVALKLVKWGMDTKEVVARFESERQALALMSHPNIATVLDAGATEQGRPYFAMEFVQGVPITEYCNVNRLTTPERLALFIRVCQGVQHAHQKGVIHRDMKPSNVLVAIEGDRPVPKIIDFGVAKATAQRLTEQTVFTRLGQWIGTPEYMSPEQAEMTGLDIDTRTDVYSLGVMLYELLVGAVPFDPKELRRIGFDEMRRKIREEEPLRPSTKVSSLGDASQVAAKQRRTDLHGLVRTLRGDLDWITMRAIEKDRTRRYASPSELSADIERYLRDEPVLAGPPGTTYRVRKFVRRHRLGVIAAAVVVAALVLGVVGATIGLMRAEREAAAARRASEFLVGVFEVMDPGAPFGPATSVAGILDRGAERIEGSLSDQPLMQARLMSTIGRVYLNFGRYTDARPLLEKALALQRRYLGEEHPDVVHTLNALGFLRTWTADYVSARQCFEAAVKIAERSLGPDDPATVTYLNNLAWLLWRMGDFEASRTYVERALERGEGALGRDHPAVADALSTKAILLREFGQNDEALRADERALAIRERVFGPDHTVVGWTLHDLARSYQLGGRRQEAQACAERALAIQEKALGPNHMAVAWPLALLGELARDRGDLTLARSCLERALAIRTQALGPDHPDAALILLPLANIHRRSGDHETSRRLLERAVQIQEKAFGPNHPEVAHSLTFLARSAYECGRLADAHRMCERAAAILRSPATPRNPYFHKTVYNLACVAALMGEREQAINLLREAVEGGFPFPIMLEDPDLASLRGDPRFEATLSEVRKRLGRGPT
jgi:non-specific serine/threonine protein kinase/serine/threonine-protein kinase